jgi:hypothetical protein
METLPFRETIWDVPAMVYNGCHVVCTPHMPGRSLAHLHLNFQTQVRCAILTAKV